VTVRSEARCGCISGRVADLAGQMSKILAIQLIATVATSGVQLVYPRAFRLVSGSRSIPLTATGGGRT